MLILMLRKTLPSQMGNGIRANNKSGAGSLAENGLL